jgi:hypothetical protein
MSTDAQDVQTWYDAALKQIAGESYFGGPLDFNFQSGDGVVAALMQGNTPLASAPEQYVRMTVQQATAFLGQYRIIDQCENTSSGFSATLLLDTRPGGRYSLVFRSTEYKNSGDGGDYERDGYYGADGEIADVGFALGQLRDMEWYLAELRAGRLQNGSEADELAIKNALAATQKLDIVAYSLSGNLATVFTELHPELINTTTVFNAVGRGTINAHAAATPGQSIGNVLGTFEELLANPDYFTRFDLGLEDADPALGLQLAARSAPMGFPQVHGHFR